MERRRRHLSLTLDPATIAAARAAAAADGRSVSAWIDRTIVAVLSMQERKTYEDALTYARLLDRAELERGL